MNFKPLAAVALVAACNTSGAQTLVATSPEEACEIEAALLVGLPANAVNAVSSSVVDGKQTFVLDLSGGTADCRIGPDGRVESIELR